MNEYSKSYRHWKTALAFILVITAFETMASGIISPVQPLLIKQFSATEARAGIINGMLLTLWSATQLCTAPLLGALADRYGRRPIIVASTVGLTIEYVVMALAPSLWWLALGLFIAALTSGSFAASCAYIADLTSLESRARAYGLIWAASAAGLVIGPMLGGMLAEVSPRAPFWIAGAVSLTCFLYAIFVLPESLTPDKRNPFSWARANPFGALHLLMSKRELALLSLIVFCLTFSRSCFIVLFVIYASHSYGWDAGKIGVILTAAGLVGLAVQTLMVQPAVRRLGNSRTVIVGLLLSASGDAIMAAAPIEALFLLGVILHTFYALALPALQSLITEQASERLQGQLQGAVMSVVSISSIVSPLFFGEIYAASVDDKAWIAWPGLVFVASCFVQLTAALIARRLTPQAHTNRPETPRPACR